MLTNKKINSIQSQIIAAIAAIADKENVVIEFDNISYTDTYYQTKMIVKSKETMETDFIKESKKLGFTQNIVGMEFEYDGNIYKINNIKLRYRKYPVIATVIKGPKMDRTVKFSVYLVKKQLGGDKVINRNANLDKLVK
jgi:hypothetical protein